MIKKILTTSTVLLLVACSSQSKQAEEEIAQPVNCATAEGDIRILESEKAHTVEEIAKGVTAIAPAGLVLGVVSGTEGDKLEIASGEYNDKIDKKIAEIKSTCDQ